MTTKGPASFGVDGVAPPRPSNVAVAGLNAAGWTHELTSRVTWETPREAQETTTESGVASTNFDVNPADGMPEQPDPPAATGPPFEIEHLSLPADGRWELWLRQIDRAGNVGEPRVVFVGRDIDAPPPASIHDGGWINRGELIAGHLLQWDRPTDLSQIESGICGYSVAYGDGVPPGIDPDYAGDVTSGPVPASLADGLHRVRLRTISCAGLGSETAEAQIGVDSVPPAVTMAGDGIGTWSTKPATFHVDAADGLSGVIDLVYAVDGGPEIGAPPTGASVELGDGVHTIRAHATDRARNRSSDTEATVLVDTNAPKAWFEQRDARQPSRITAHLEDGVSGVASARLEYARVDAGASDAERGWRRLGQVVEPPVGEDRSVTLTAVLPDATLPDGAYLMRVVASDRAGNVATGTTESDGNTTSMRLPLRERPALSLALAGLKRTCTSRSRPRRVCRKKTTVDLKSAVRNRLVAFGESVALAGELRNAGGDPIAGGEVTVYEEPRFGRRVVATKATTDSNGRFVYRPRRGRSRNFTAHYTGDATTLPVESNRAALGVRGGVEFSVSPRRARPGRVLVFKGRLMSGGDGMPSSGKIVFIKYLVGGVWRPAVASPKTDLKGRFRELYPLAQGVAKPTRLRFRVEVPEEDPWPYQYGYSREQTVVVRP
jgi:hypothetical protein